MDMKKIFEDIAYREAKKKAIIDAVEKQNGTPLKPHIKRAVLQCMDNAISEDRNARAQRGMGLLNEATTTDNIAFLGVQLPVISAILPSLVLDEIAIVQALDRRIGAVFFMDVLRGTTKGGDDQAGSTLVSSVTGQASGAASLNYATNHVYNESMGVKGSGNVFTKVMTSAPMVTGSAMVVVSGASAVIDTLVVVSTSGGTDVLQGATLTGTVDLATGTVTVNADGNSVTAAVSYKYNYEKAATSIPEININLRPVTLTAEDFMLRSKFSLPAAVDLEKAHGINLEEVLIRYLGGEMKFAMDHRGIDMIVDAAGGAAAATTPGTFTATVGDGQEWVFKKFQFMDFVQKASNNIFSKTKRAKANFIVCGLNAARIIVQMSGDDFKEIDVPKPFGPHKVGTLKGMPVIADPYIDENTIVFGYRGSEFLEAGFIYAPYIPLFSTPTVTLSDLYSQKAFYSAAGYLVTNAGMFCKGSVVGLSY